MHASDTFFIATFNIFFTCHGFHLVAFQASSLFLSTSRVAHKTFAILFHYKPTVGAFSHLRSNKFLFNNFLSFGITNMVTMETCADLRRSMLTSEHGQMPIHSQPIPSRPYQPRSDPSGQSLFTGYNGQCVILFREAVFLCGLKIFDRQHQPKPWERN